MKKTFIIIPFLLSTLLLKAQVKDSLVSVEKNLSVLNFLSPGFTYEIGLSKNTTLDINAGLYVVFQYLYQSNGTRSTSTTNYRLAPASNISYRYYYNLNKRNEKGKNALFNSGNYIAFSTYFQGKPISGNIETKNFTMYAGPVWGFQRTYNQRFNLLLDLGLGYTNYAESRIAPIGNFKLGVRLGKTRK